MTRAVVANLNRQKSNGGDTPNGGGITSLATPVPKTYKKTSPYKSLPPQPPPPQGKELPDVPEFYIVRPAPSTANAKVERNDRRAFINRGMMERMNIYQGSVVLIQRHDPERMAGMNLETSDDLSSEYDIDEEVGAADQTTVGIAWPMDRIEPNGTTLTMRLMKVVRVTSSLRQSAGLQLGDHVVLSPYRSPIDEANEVVLQQEESADAPAEREALRFYLRDELCIPTLDRANCSTTSTIPLHRHAS
jgi:hypothetical protein